MSLIDNAELKEAKYTPLDIITGDYECLYIEQGGTLTYEQQDAMIVRLTSYAKKLEKENERLTILVETIGL